MAQQDGGQDAASLGWRRVACGRGCGAARSGAATPRRSAAAPVAASRGVEPAAQRLAVLAGQRLVGNPARGLHRGASGMPPAAPASLRRWPRAADRTAHRPAARPHPAPPACRRRPGGAPACRDPRRRAVAPACSVRSGASNGSASSAARAAARLPAASPSKHRIGAGESRHSSSSCSSVSAVPERGDGAADAGLRQGDHVHIAFDHHQRRAASHRLARQDPARRACGAWRTAPSPAR